MRYILKDADRPLLEFSANMQSSEADLQIQKIHEENRAFLPLNLALTNEGVERWLKHRTIPKNRAYVDAMLSKTRLSINRPAGPAGQKKAVCPPSGTIPPHLCRFALAGSV